MTSIRLANIALALDHAPTALDTAVRERLGLTHQESLKITVFRRAYDARKKSDIHFIYTLDVDLSPESAQQCLATAKNCSPTPDMGFKFAAYAPDNLQERPVVIGTGPCGLFAALVLAQAGFKPIILERGKPVRERTKDTWGLWRKSVLQPESNVQFGEGGAGTFSDGKLYSQVKDSEFYSRKVLEEMVKGGAPDEILYVSKPHVGTFRLVKVVQYLRDEITRLGGEYRFQQRVTDFKIEDGRMQALLVEDASGVVSELPARHVVLAIGHSARDTFYTLHDRGVAMQAKPFSVGFRIEHPQSLIDRARFGKFAGHPMLGAADYKLVHHAKNGRSVYSFCMCPGGTVVAATSEEGRVVTNGMSQYSRNERNANAGIVVGIEPSDYDFDQYGQPLVSEAQRAHPLAGVVFQRALESGAYVLGGSNYSAPAQRVGDFLKTQASSQLGTIEPSYKPGVRLINMADAAQPALPMYAIEAIQEALPAFGRQIAGFDLPDAILTGVETRTSSPIRISRYYDNHEQALQSPSALGLYPAGEGAGYAGGIMSAAIDGIKVAQALACAMAQTHQSQN